MGNFLVFIWSKLRGFEMDVGRWFVCLFVCSLFLSIEHDCSRETPPKRNAVARSCRGVFQSLWLCELLWKQGRKDFWIQTLEKINIKAFSTSHGKYLPFVCQTPLISHIKSRLFTIQKESSLNETFFVLLLAFQICYSTNYKTHFNCYKSYLYPFSIVQILSRQINH